MSLLGGKKIILGISGGIAAYKTPILIRELIKQKTNVRVVMTPASKKFVTPLTLSTVSKNPVLSSFESSSHDNPIWNDHVEIGSWADLLLIAPATSNTISSMVNGRCNNLLLAVYLSAKCKTFIAPSMDLDMYDHPSNQKNLKKLKNHGNIILPVGKGPLASGLYGNGRMLEPNEIISFLINYYKSNLPLAGKNVLITSGPTYEKIDPVRFIGNHSSGKMGFALAEVAARRGANVVLVTGPTNEKIHNPLVEVHSVLSADNMYEEVKKHYAKCDIAIASAAVSDFKVKSPAKKKIKKSQGIKSLDLVPTKDVLAYMGQKKKNQFLVGFALETENELKNAKIKLKEKNLNAIVLNSLNDKRAGFSSNTNKISYIQHNRSVKKFPLQSKLDCANSIFEQILSS
ncbi:bifunctional phosphopantothenoylcysteine decarboxylase/phosphopantothenate--cysteine ligase CoaBC [bacterium]|nr:bifunctional phosphopantothenoylcysteine decarboxylase/phosphopantothenate--cysteine ligase CoaBC [bacterium]